MTEPSTKERILEAAIAVIDEKGEAGIRIDDLLREVGVAAPTLYHHFGNREGLVLAAQAERFLRTLRVEVPLVIEAFNKCETIDDLRAALRFTVSLRGDRSNVQRRLRRLNALGSAYARPELAHLMIRAHDAMVKDVADSLRQFQTRGLIRNDIDLDMVVAWYNGSVLGSLLVEIDETVLDPDKWSEVMLDAVEHLLFGI